MTSFFWSAGHIDWFFLGIVVFSVLCLLTTDVIWRVMPTSRHKLLSIAAIIWASGVAVLIACWFV